LCSFKTSRGTTAQANVFFYLPALESTSSFHQESMFSGDASWGCADVLFAFSWNTFYMELDAGLRKRLHG